MPSLAASSPLAPALLVDGPKLLLLPRLVRLGLEPWLVRLGMAAVVVVSIV